MAADAVAVEQLEGIPAVVGVPGAVVGALEGVPAVAEEVSAAVVEGVPDAAVVGAFEDPVVAGRLPAAFEEVAASVLPAAVALSAAASGQQQGQPAESVVEAPDLAESAPVLAASVSAPAGCCIWYGGT